MLPTLGSFTAETSHREATRRDSRIARPSSWASDWSLPSPRNDDMLSASAVLRAALTGSFLDLDDESLDLQMLELWKIVELFLFSVFAAGSW